MPRRRGKGQGGPNRNKFRARKTMVDGFIFDSQLEAMCWLSLKARVERGEIYALDRQQSFDLDINGQHVCRYVSDFTYRLTSTGEKVVADAKGYLTEVYRLKKKMMRACHNIDILELPEKRTGPVKKPEVRKRKRRSG